MARKMTPLEQAAASENRVALLRELRTHAIGPLQESECLRDVEPLIWRIAALAAEIDALAAAEMPSAADQIARRRAQRRGSA
jgi:hypothetical protein